MTAVRKDGWVEVRGRIALEPELCALLRELADAG
jgi:hypothetical protein